MRRLVLLGLAVSLSACGASTPSGPNPATPGGTADDRAQTVATLQSAWLAWRVSGPASYRYTHRRTCFCLERGPVVVTVRGGRVASVVDGETGAPVPADRLSQYTTVDGLFAQLFEAVDAQPYAIQATYDDRLGYPVEAYVDQSPQIADEESGFSVSAFEPL